METELGVRKFDEGFLNNLEQYKELIQAIHSNVNCVGVEIHYCLGQYRQAIVRNLGRDVPGLTTEWIYFEVDIGKANENCRRRTNKSDVGGLQHIEINSRIGPAYSIPPGVIPRQIVQISKQDPNK
jgi:hypothetical protein